MKNVDLTRYGTRQYAVIEVKTGRVAQSYESSISAERVAEAVSNREGACVIIDLHTMEICDVFADGGRLSVGLSGIRFRGMEAK